MPQLAAALLLAFLQQLVTSVVEPDGFIKGVAVDAVTGQGIEGVSIRVAEGSMRTVTGADGTFRLGLKVGEYTVLFEKQGYIGSNYGNVPNPRVQVSAGSENSLRLEIVPAGYLSGRVLGDEGEPLAGVFVYARKSLGPSAIMDETARDGSFQLLDLAPGSYKLEVRTPESVRKSKKIVADGMSSSYLPVVWYPGVADPHAAVSVDLAAGQRFSGFDFRMRRYRLTSLNLRVTDSLTKKPVPGVEARLRLVGDPDWAEHRLNASGQARFELVAPGEYELALYAGEPSRTLPFLRTLHLTPPEAEAQIALPQFRPVRGRITGKFRHPVLVRIGTKSVGFASDGGFEIMAPPGEWRVSVRPSPIDPSVYVAQVRYGEQDALEVPIITTETANPALEIVLADGARKISGRVLDSDDKGVARIMVRCAIQGQVSATLTDQDGYFRLGNLKPGEYQIDAGTNCSGTKTRVDLSNGDVVLNSVRACKPETP